jgi:hypothetical protein
MDDQPEGDLLTLQRLYLLLFEPPHYLPDPSVLLGNRVFPFYLCLGRHLLQAGKLEEQPCGDGRGICSEERQGRRRRRCREERACERRGSRVGDIERSEDRGRERRRKGGRGRGRGEEREEPGEERPRCEGLGPEGRRQEGVGREEGEKRGRRRRVATGAARWEEAREGEERVEMRPRRARQRGGRGHAAAAGGEPRELVGEEEIRVRGHQVAELVESLHLRRQCGSDHEADRAGGGDNEARGAEMRSSPPFLPFGFFFRSTHAREQLVEPRKGEAVVVWVDGSCLIFSVDSAAEMLGPRRPAARQAEEEETRRALEERRRRRRETLR